MTEQIKLTVAGTELVFEPNVTAYNKFINDMSMDNKVAPAVSYLKRIVATESKQTLEGFITRPGAPLQLVAKVNELYAPELEIEVKN
ncbi:putative phage tail assembly chaperone [Citrobacter portucalensis]|uniref:putative phage tail assembly chaperone n=1 Tax=Citrobacter portucalensis TaxID=1639133 RepID=UPI003AA957AC